MEVQDGFIVGVFNYCDRWCERCPLSRRCRLFADEALIPRDGGSLLKSLNRIAADPDGGDRVSGAFDQSKLPQDLEPSFGPDPYLVANAGQLRTKFDRARRSASPAVRLAMETIQHFSMLVPLKMLRAIAGATTEGIEASRSDACGSGKVALLGLERMRAAWHTLIETNQFTAQDAAPFLSEIDRLVRNVERSVPHARVFVRPGFDEPEEVAMLEAVAQQH